MVLRSTSRQDLTNGRCCPAARCAGQSRLLAVRCHAGASSSSSVSRRSLLTTGPALAGTAGLWLPGMVAAATAEEEKPSSVYDFSALQYGKERSLSDYDGKNVNYPGLRTLVQKYNDQGFTLIGFPCNQFGGQAPGTSEEERQFAFKKFKTEFDIFDKVEVNGPDAHPLYKFLRAQQPRSKGAPPNPFGVGAGNLEWNYVKFLIDRYGKPVGRYSSAFDPLNFEDDVKLLLDGQGPRPKECRLHPERAVCQGKAGGRSA